jgi:hypothetical protein
MNIEANRAFGGAIPAGLASFPAPWRAGHLSASQHCAPESCFSSVGLRGQGAPVIASHFGSPFCGPKTWLLVSVWMAAEPEARKIASQILIATRPQSFSTKYNEMR